MRIEDQLANKIIEEQELIIGPIAWSEARKVNGLEIHNEKAKVAGQTKSVLDALVSRYARLFGEASVEVCKDATQPFLGKLPKAELPARLL
ncbi:MAG: hypothetical protein V1895_03405 [Parcubacteria group bacterium]